MAAGRNDVPGKRGNRTDRRVGTVHRRFMMAYIPSVLVVVALFVGGFEFLTFHEAYDALRSKMTRLSSNLSIVLAEPVFSGQEEMVSSVVANAVNDQDIAFISVTDSHGASITRLSRDGTQTSESLTSERPIRFGGGGESRTVGYVTVAMTDARLLGSLLERLYFALALAIVLVAAIIVVGSVVYRRVIVGPLMKLQEVINQTDSGKGSVRLSPQSDDEFGEVFRAFNMMRDRQRRNEIELETARAGLEKRVRERTADLKAAHDEALAASRAKSQFLANMSHEFRTPLNSIIGFAELLSSDLAKQDDARNEYAQNVRESGVHLLTLINDLLDLSKAEAGKLEIQDAMIDVASMVRACVSMVERHVAEKGLDVDVNIPASSPAIEGDERKIRQMILNLLSNATKFTPKGGKISVFARPTEAGGLEISVRDTGIGVSQQDIRRILQPFVQIDSTYTRKHTGTGLGLPLVRTLAELHGGEFELESEVGVGTTATIRFPAKRVHYDVRMASVAE